MSKIIPLTQGKETIVDDDMFDYLNRWKWFFANGYAVRKPVHGENGKTIFMHRVIADTPDGMDTDHTNCNKLDNRSDNLRICTRSQNKMNAGKHVDNTSGFKGVYQNNGSWTVRICNQRKCIYLGCFKSKEEAASAYDEAAKKYHGEFARVNFAKGIT